MKYSDLNEKGDYNILFIHFIKINETTYYQRSKGVILNRTKEYYKNNQERLEK